MATTPTNLPIPSEDPRDLKFNAGKFDEVMTSDAHYYVDRFGVKRWTISGFEYTAREAIRAYGYITMDSFEDGATLTLPNQVLRWESNGEYYRWDGAFPKAVSAGSTPATTGGVGIGAWISVGDASLRSDLNSTNGASLIKTSSGDSVQLALDKLNNRTTGWKNLWEFIPENLHQYFSNLSDSNTNVPSVNDYLDAATAYCEANMMNLIIPGGYYMMTREWALPKEVHVRGVSNSQTLLLGSASFSGTRMVHCDNAGWPRYNLSDLQIHGLNYNNVVGLHIGASNDSHFERLVIRDTLNGGIKVRPEHADANDVVNLILDDCRTLNTLSPLTIQSNASISSVGTYTAGNITGVKVANSQLVSFDGAGAEQYGLTNGGICISVTAEADTIIFAVNIDQVSTATVKNAFMKLESQGTSKNLYNCQFTSINGESQKVGGGLDSNNTAPSILLSGTGVQDNIFDSCYIGAQGAGVQIADSKYNTFYDISFTDNAPVGNDNPWIYCNSGSEGNKFLDMKCGYRMQAYAPLNAQFYQSFLGRKVGDDGINNEFQFTDATSTPSIILNRGKVFAVTGGKLTNFPDSGGDATNWSWAIQPSGALRVSIPANTGGSKTLTFPAVSSKLGFKFSYNIVSGSPTVLTVGVGGTTIPAASLTADSSVHNISAVNPASGTGAMVITANASATAATVIDIYDIGVAANQIPMLKIIRQSMYIE